MKEAFVTTENYSRLKEAVSNLQNLPETAPRMGLGFGNFGLGKTFSLEKIALEEGAILLRAGQTWSKRSLLDILCVELGLDTRGHSPKLFERVRDAFVAEPRILIIDEVDALLKSDKHGVLELVRDLHDETPIIVFFVGMEEANAKFKRHRHYYSRIVELVQFLPTGRGDIERFCELSEVKITPDLVSYFTEKYPNLRQIKVMLLRLENFCAINGYAEVDLKLFKQSGAEHGISRG